MQKKIDDDLLKRCLAQESFGWEDFVDRLMPPIMFLIEEMAKKRNLSLSESEKRQFCEAVFRSFQHNDFQVLREYEFNSSLRTYLFILSRRLIVAFFATTR